MKNILFEEKTGEVISRVSSKRIPPNVPLRVGNVIYDGILRIYDAETDTMEIYVKRRAQNCN